MNTHYLQIVTAAFLLAQVACKPANKADLKSIESIAGIREQACTISQALKDRLPLDFLGSAAGNNAIRDAWQLAFDRAPVAVKGVVLSGSVAVDSVGSRCPAYQGSYRSDATVQSPGCVVQSSKGVVIRELNSPADILAHGTATLSIAAFQSARISVTKKFESQAAKRLAYFSNRIAFLARAFLGDLATLRKSGHMDPARYQSLEVMSKNNSDVFSFMVFGHFADSLGCRGIESIEQNFPLTAYQFSNRIDSISLKEILADKDYFAVGIEARGLSLAGGEGLQSVSAIPASGQVILDEIPNLSISPAVFGDTQGRLAGVFEDPRTLGPALSPLEKQARLTQAINEGIVPPNLVSAANTYVEYAGYAASPLNNRANAEASIGEIRSKAQQVADERGEDNQFFKAFTAQAKWAETNSRFAGENAARYLEKMFDRAYWPLSGKNPWDE